MHEFKDPTRLTRVATLAVLTYMVIHFLLGAGTAVELMAPSLIDSPRYLALAAVAVVMLVSLIACIVIVGMWIYRVSANAHAVSGEMTISPEWAVGWYFVPIMNLFRPFQAMKETWLASHYRGNWHGEPTPALLTAWWALWLITNILGNMGFRLSLENVDGSIAGPSAVIDVIVGILNVPLCLVLVTMMRRLCRAQLHARHDETFA